MKGDTRPTGPQAPQLCLEMYEALIVLRRWDLLYFLVIICGYDDNRGLGMLYSR
jgi:hypothetical protein